MANGDIGRLAKWVMVVIICWAIGFSTGINFKTHTLYDGQYQHLRSEVDNLKTKLDQSQIDIEKLELLLDTRVSGVGIPGKIWIETFHSEFGPHVNVAEVALGLNNRIRIPHVTFD